MNVSPSWIIFLILVVGIGYGLVWFSGTSIADALRSFGAPIPYCTFLRPSTGAELDFRPVPAGLLYEANDVLGYLTFKPNDTLLTTLCSVSDRGGNVRLILSQLLAKNRAFLDFLDKCKIKYRSADVLLPNVIVARGCVMTLGYDKDLIVCDEDYASRVYKYLEGMWRA